MKSCPVEEYGVPELPESTRLQLEIRVDGLTSQAVRTLMGRQRLRRSWAIITSQPVLIDGIPWSVVAETEVPSGHLCPSCHEPIETERIGKLHHRFGLYRLSDGSRSRYLCGVCLVGYDPIRLIRALIEYHHNGPSRFALLKLHRPLLIATEWWLWKHPHLKDNIVTGQSYLTVQRTQRYLLQGRRPSPKLAHHLRRVLHAPEYRWERQLSSETPSYLREFLRPENFAKLSPSDRVRIRDALSMSRHGTKPPDHLLRRLRGIFERRILELGESDRLK